LHENLLEPAQPDPKCKAEKHACLKCKHNLLTLICWLFVGW